MYKYDIEIPLNERLSEGKKIFTELQELGHFLKNHEKSEVKGEIRDYTVKFQIGGEFRESEDVLPDIKFRVVIQDLTDNYTRLGDAFVPTGHGVVCNLFSDKEGNILYEGYLDGLAFIVQEKEALYKMIQEKAVLKSAENLTHHTVMEYVTFVEKTYENDAILKNGVTMYQRAYGDKTPDNLCNYEGFISYLKQESIKQRDDLATRLLAVAEEFEESFEKELTEENDEIER